MAESIRYIAAVRYAAMNETNQTTLDQLTQAWESGDYLDLLWRILQFPLGRVGATDVTILAIIQLMLLVIAVFLATAIVRNYFLGKILKRTRLTPSIQYAIAKIIGYILIAAGLYIALQTVGIDLSALAVVAGAIGVGIGFGLQNIISNFVSGLIILAERPIAIGDRVEVNEVAGTVEQINLRSTTVLTNDNISIIVPNSDFLAKPVINWSHGDPKVRMRLPFGVAYGSDVEKVKRVVPAMAARHNMVLEDPAPGVFFVGFGESSLDFELVVWTREATTRPRGFQSDLYFGLEKVLRENNLEIPFPQRDLHLRSGKLVMENPSGGQSVSRIT